MDWIITTQLERGVELYASIVITRLSIYASLSAGIQLKLVTEEEKNTTMVQNKLKKKKDQRCCNRLPLMRCHHANTKKLKWYWRGHIVVGGGAGVLVDCLCQH